MTAPQSKSKAIARLRKALEKIPELQQQSRDSTDFEKWQRDTRVAISYAFEEKSHHATDFTQIAYDPIVFTLSDNDVGIQKAYEDGLKDAAAMLESMIDEIEEYREDDNSHKLKRADMEREPNTTKVFLIHGRDKGVRETVARYLERLGLEPVILDDQANQGKTIIEKLSYRAGALRGHGRNMGEVVRWRHLRVEREVGRRRNGVIRPPGRTR